MAKVDLLTKGLYTVPEAARLIGAPMAKVRGWIAGYPKTKGGPVLKNEVGWMDGKLAMSFTNLMEIRFIQYFSNYGVKVVSIRLMAEEARKILRHPHPFATATVFKTDGRKIFAEVAEKTGDKHLYDLRAKNWAIVEVIEQSLKRGVVYNPKGDAVGWHPRQDIAPNVIIFPQASFGQPVLEESRIPTRTLFRAFMAEGETYESVANWYRVPKKLVEEAIIFETKLQGEPLAA